MEEGRFVRERGEGCLARLDDVESSERQVAELEGGVAQLERGKREAPEVDADVTAHGVEGAGQVEDLIDRRAGFLFWNIDRRLERLRYGAKVIQNELGISSAEFEQQYRDYAERLSRLHRLP